jgi:hypothetical protein
MQINYFTGEIIMVVPRFFLTVTMSVLLFLCAIAESKTVANLDAKTTKDIWRAIPPWSSSRVEMYHNEDYFLQDWTSDDPITSPGYISSPQITDLMKRHCGQYGIEFKIQPLNDIPPAGSSHYANLVISWSDDANNYSFSIDKYIIQSNPEKGGAITYGGNSMIPAVSGIDFSTARTIFIGYKGELDTFDFYVDGVLNTSVPAEKIAGEYSAINQDVITFGDTTSGQPEPYSIDIAAKWFFVRMHDVAVPEGNMTGENQKEIWPALDGIGLYCITYDTEQETVEFIKKCKESKISYLMPSISSGGDALWKTDIIDFYPPTNAKRASGYDGLAAFIKHAHTNGLKVYPSVAICSGGKLISENPEWETRDREGKLSSKTAEAALAMSYAGARKAKIAAILDLINGYDIDGILLDYCRYPENTAKPSYTYGYYGYDKPLLDACMNIYGFDPREEPINSDLWNIFNKMRMDSITSFVRELKEAVNNSGKKIRLMGFAGENPEQEAASCGRDNIAWLSLGLTEDYIMGIYPDPISKRKELVQRVGAIIPKDKIYSSITPFQGFQKTPEEMIAAAREQLDGGSKGIWIYRSDAMDKYNLWGCVKDIAALQEKYNSRNK